MRRTLWVTFCIILLAVSTAAAAPRFGLRPIGVCSRDINPWGHASNCSCDDDNVYDERSGMCLKGNAVEKMIVQGAVSAGMMAIGGETTGFLITTSDGEAYELILKITDQEKLNKLSGMQFEIEGELITIEAIEFNERNALIADRLTVLEQYDHRNM